jgi:hypothetical protein
MKKVFKILILPLLLLIWYGLSTKGEYYSVMSPNGQYRVYASAYNYELYLPIPFRRYGDMSGRVYLYDEVAKKIIDSAPIEMTSLALDVRWRKDEAYFIGGDFISFKLPHEINVKERVR